MAIVVPFLKRLDIFTTKNVALAMRLPYATERPLFCHDNRLYVGGDLQVEEVASEGNELTFTDRARHLTLLHVEANDVPAPSGKAPPAQ